MYSRILYLKSLSSSLMGNTYVPFTFSECIYLRAQKYAKYINFR